MDGLKQSIWQIRKGTNGRKSGWGGVALPSRASFFSSIHCFQRCNTNTDTNTNSDKNRDTNTGEYTQSKLELVSFSLPIQSHLFFYFNAGFLFVSSDRSSLQCTTICVKLCHKIQDCYYSINASRCSTRDYRNKQTLKQTNKCNYFYMA